jgi:hypothetical protein
VSGERWVVVVEVQRWGRATAGGVGVILLLLQRVKERRPSHRRSLHVLSDCRPLWMQITRGRRRRRRRKR